MNTSQAIAHQLSCGNYACVLDLCRVETCWLWISGNPYGNMFILKLWKAILACVAGDLLNW